MCFNRKQKLTNKSQIIIKITITNSNSCLSSCVCLQYLMGFCEFVMGIYSCMFSVFAIRIVVNEAYMRTGRGVKLNMQSST